MAKHGKQKIHNFEVVENLNVTRNKFEVHILGKLRLHCRVQRKKPRFDYIFLLFKS